MDCKAPRRYFELTRALVFPLQHLIRRHATKYANFFPWIYFSWIKEDPWSLDTYYAVCKYKDLQRNLKVHVSPADSSPLFLHKDVYRVSCWLHQIFFLESHPESVEELERCSLTPVSDATWSKRRLFYFG